MIITKKINPATVGLENVATVLVDFQWYETNKRIQRKVARDGEEFKIKLLNENPNFKHGEVLFQEDKTKYVINILPCECIVIIPKSNFETASICYEIGNKHLPLFYEDEKLLVPFEKPLYHQFYAMGFEVYQDKKVLLYPLKTTVTPHGENSTLFSKIMNLTQK